MRHTYQIPRGARGQAGESIRAVGPRGWVLRGARVTARGCGGWQGWARGIQADPVFRERVTWRPASAAGLLAGFQSPPCSLSEKRALCLRSLGRQVLWAAASGFIVLVAPGGRAWGQVAVALAGFGLRACCQWKFVLALRFISLKAATLFVRLKELKLDLVAVEPSKVIRFLLRRGPRPAVLAPRALPDLLRSPSACFHLGDSEQGS